MSTTIQVDIVSAEESVFQGSCEMLHASGTMGEMGIAHGHTPLITTLSPGEIQLRNGDELENFYISGGLLEVQPHKVTVLSDTAVRAGDIDEAAAEEAKTRAEKMMQERGSDFDYSLVESQLAQAAAQLRAIRRLKQQLK